MNYPSPPPSPPPYADISKVPPPSLRMDHLFDLRRGLKWDLARFCNALHGAHSKASQYGVLSIQHRKRLYQDYQYEFVVLDVVPLVPGTHTPKPNAPHTLIEVGRVGGMAPFFGLWGIATDEVCVLRQEDEAFLLQQAAARESIGEGSQAGTGTPGPEASMIAGELLATLSWQIEIPGLLDVFLIITSLSLSFPNHNVLTCPCFWLAREIYQTLRHGYRPVLESNGDDLWQRTKFLVMRLLTPRPPDLISQLCFRQAEWSHRSGLEQRPVPSSSSGLPSSAQP